MDFSTDLGRCLWTQTASGGCSYLRIHYIHVRLYIGSKEEEKGRLRERLPTPVFWPGECHGWRSLVGCKQSDTIERLHFLSFLWGTDIYRNPSFSSSFSFLFPAWVLEMVTEKTGPLVVLWAEPRQLETPRPIPWPWNLSSTHRSCSRSCFRDTALRQ